MERRIVALDGLRGLAIIVVVLAHYLGEVEHGTRWMAFGWAGVDLFFVLSGFLIGGILLQTDDVKTFYIRRFFRIFPIYYIVMLAVGAPWFYFLYTQNFVMSWTGTQPPPWLLPTWTLTVEEQFYLLLPWFLMDMPRRNLTKALVFLILLAPVYRFLAGGISAMVLLPCRWDLLLIGVLAAHLKNHKLARPACLVGLAIAVASGYVSDRLFSIAGILGTGIAFGAFIMLVANGAPEAERFENHFLRFFGKISYCLYLIHQPVAWAIHGLALGTAPDIATPLEASATVFSGFAAVGIAVLSWRYIEEPLIAFGHRWSYSESRSSPTELLGNPGSP